MALIDIDYQVHYLGWSFELGGYGFGVRLLIRNGISLAARTQTLDGMREREWTPRGLAPSVSLEDSTR